MQTPFVLLRHIGKALLNAVGGGALGEVLVEVLPDLAKDVWDWWSRDRNAEQRRAELQALAQAAAPELAREVARAVQEVAAHQPPAVCQALTVYLLQTPAAVRQSLR